MKRTICLLGLLMLAGLRIAEADAPRTLSYQGVLKEASGMPLPNDEYQVTFRIYNVETGGTAQWTETSTVTVFRGTFSTILGKGTPLDLEFDETYWLGMSVEGGSELDPRTELTSAPYAFRATIAESVVGGGVGDDDWVICGNNMYAGVSGNIGIGTETPSEKLVIGTDYGYNPMGNRIVVTGSRPGLTLMEDAANNGFLYYRTDTDKMYIGTRVGGTSHDTMFLDEGQVGLGTNDPDAKLHVVDDRDSPHIAVIEASYTAQTGQDVSAIRGSSYPGTPDGTGGEFRGSYKGADGYASSSWDYIWIYGVYGEAQGSGGANTPIGVYGTASGGDTRWAGYFSGDVRVTGSINPSAARVQIDHPLDPANKYMSHSLVQSQEMANLYSGNVVLDAGGTAWVELPEWFEALNQDFRYQVTAIEVAGPNLHIAEKISGNRFRIAGGESGMEVSWQVTGIRNDPYAKANRIPVEQDKSVQERGKYLHPEIYGQPETMAVDYQEKNLRSRTELPVRRP